MKALLLAVALLGVGAPALAQDSGDAYLDPIARELVQGVRARRATVDLSIEEYRTDSRDRFSVSHRLVGRERLLFRRETAVGVHWRREGPIDLDIRAAREGSSLAGDSVTVPGDLDDYFFLAFDPLDSEFLFSLEGTNVRHPFAVGGEAHYRFATGDSSSIRLPDGRVVQLRELRVIPRRSDPQLVSGSFWLHTETHAVVQAVFRPAQEYRFGMTRSDRNVSVTMAPAGKVDVPLLLRSVRGEISQITVDYGLWELRWWLPRYVRVAGSLQAGALGNLTLDYERRYGVYDVVADTTRARTAIADAELPCRNVRRASDVTILAGPDSVRAQWERKAETRRGWRTEAPDTAAERCLRQFRVTAPATADSMLTSEELPASIYAESGLLPDFDAAAVAARLARLPLPDLQLGHASFEWGPTGPGLLRYNRVEGLSAGARASLDLGRGEAVAELRYGIADQLPKGLLGLTLRGQERWYRVTAYRDLRPVDDLAQPLSLGHSVRALLFGHDDALYFRARGAALDITPRPTQPPHYAIRLYAERQAAVHRNTDFSLPHVFDSDFRFRDNITAERATQYGGELMLQRDFGLNPDAFRFGLRSAVRAEAGTFQFVRPELAVRLNAPPLGPLAIGLEGAAGTTFGSSPLQSHWYLGGTRTLRGYRIGDAAGPAYWRGRAELGSALPIVRASIFTDVGWAGAAEGAAWRESAPLWSVGAGASFLDGMLRFDVARALREPGGWRLHFYLGGLH